MKEDINLLKDFVSEVYRWLRFCYLGKPRAEPSRWPSIEIRPELEDLSVPAWEEFKDRYPLEKLLAPIDSENKVLQDILFSHGLYGSQLRYKLHLVEMAAEKARAGLAGWKRKLIDIIDVVIDSLSPTGIAGALKELKDALTGSLPDEGESKKYEDLLRGIREKMDI